MQIGLGLPQTGPGATREHIATYAQTAEESGYASLWVADHVVVPREYRSLHPSRPGGRLPDRYRPERNLLEPLTLLAFVAGVTERIRIGTGVQVLPMRQPVLHAKIIASIDHLAGGGRFTLGVGVGWAREEFEVLSASFERRGARVEEQLALMRALWSGDWVEHHGEFYEVDGWISSPAPPTPIRRVSAEFSDSRGLMGLPLDAQAPSHPRSDRPTLCAVHRDRAGSRCERSQRRTGSLPEPHRHWPVVQVSHRTGWSS